MKVKKINAVMTLLLIATLLGHYFTITYAMLTGWYDFQVCKGLARGTATAACIHVLITIAVFLRHDKIGTMNKYKKQNAKLIIQRVTGVLIALLLYFHVDAFRFLATGESLTVGQSVYVAAIEAFFFGCVFSHISVSFSKALISLGMLDSAKAAELVDKTCIILNAVFMVLGMAGLVHTLV